MSIATTNASAVAISHVADSYRRYPGEDVTFFTRVLAHRPLAGYQLSVLLPKGMCLRQATPPATSIIPMSAGARLAGQTINWESKTRLAAGQTQEYQIVAQIEPYQMLWNDYRTDEQTIQQRNGQKSHWAPPTHAPSTLVLHCRAALQNLQEQPVASEVAQVQPWPQEWDQQQEIVPIAVCAHGQYMQYLPALYEQQDDFLARFLMLFESFWAPLEQQIDHLYTYFDVKVTPPHFLKWLATWFDLALSERWSEQQQRALLTEIVQLYHQRGTRRGLQRYLELLTGGKVQITEFIAHQFRIGASARLGTGIAVGRQGAPFTFAVHVTLPTSTQAEQQTHQIIESIINAEKPVHTTYQLTIDYVSPKG